MNTDTRELSLNEMEEAAGGVSPNKAARNAAKIVNKITEFFEKLFG